MAVGQPFVTDNVAREVGGAAEGDAQEEVALVWREGGASEQEGGGSDVASSEIEFA